MDNQNKKIILLVDDDAMIVRMYQRKLEHDGFKVNLAFNGAEGIEALKKEKPDIVLLDIMMPKMNGIETLKAIKADPAYKNLPVIMLTNLGDRPDDVENCKKLGAADYLVKANVSLPQLVEKIKQYIK